jgi:hypothetical protein
MTIVCRGNRHGRGKVGLEDDERNGARGWLKDCVGCAGGAT